MRIWIYIIITFLYQSDANWLPIQYEWLNDNNQWIPCSYKQSRYLEQQYLLNKPYAFVPELGDKDEYVVVFNLQFHWIETDERYPPVNDIVPPWTSFSRKNTRRRSIRRSVVRTL